MSDKFIEEPTLGQCNARTKIGEGVYACWYPQMGGYVSKCVVKIDTHEEGCFEAWVWHNGEFPFSDGTGNDRVRHIHHCNADQFIEFGNFIKSEQS